MAKRIICIVGPTASGKSDVGVQLAKRLNGEIVSADSVQVYRGLNIGSAKISPEEMSGVAHHLIDCVDIDDTSFSVSVFRELAGAAIDEILNRGHVPIVVGGTGLYINSITYPLNFAGVPSDAAVRERLHIMEQNNPGSAYDMLLRVDRAAAENIHPNNLKRVIRALEVYEVSKKPFSSFGNDFHNESGAECEYEPIIIGLTMHRELLYSRIELRVDRMIEQGLVAEVEGILSRGYSPLLPALKTLGYRQIVDYLTKRELTLPAAVDMIKLETRHFAKRQLTWFARDKRIVWYDTCSFGDTSLLVDEILKIEGVEKNETGECSGQNAQHT